MNPFDYEVIIVGGSYAGLAAALQLGRARRRVLIVDSGERRNRFAHTAHGLLGHDGVAPEAIAAKGKAEVLAYPTVSWRDGLATEARARAGGFSVRVGDDELTAARLILATGVVDEPPDIPGVRALWGKRVFHCPYCHGYELDLEKLGALATSPLSIHHTIIVSQWSRPGDTTLFLNRSFEPDAEQLAELAKHRVAIEREPVESAAATESGIVLRLAGGQTRELAGLFVLPKSRIAGSFAEQLGLELEDGPMGPIYKTDAMKETTVPGVFACGDAARPMGSLAFAIADGVLAANALHRSLIFADPAPR